MSSDAASYTCLEEYNDVVGQIVPAIIPWLKNTYISGRGTVRY